MSESYLNRTFKLHDRENPSADAFHAIVIADDDTAGVTYVEHGKESVTVPRAHFADLIVTETEHYKPYLPLKAAQAEQAKVAAVAQDNKPAKK